MLNRRTSETASYFRQELLANCLALSEALVSTYRNTCVSAVSVEAATVVTAAVAAVQSSGEVMNTSVSVAAGSGLAVSAGMAADSAVVGAARNTAPTTAH